MFKNFMQILSIKIFEEATNYAYPVVEHLFYGKTKKEAEGYFKAHLKTDVFLRDIYNKGKWDGVKGKVTVEWL